VPVLPEATAEVCSGMLLPPTEACLRGDFAEPNDQDDPVLIESDPLCGYVQANVSPDDLSDGYAFATAKSDPVRIELSYHAQSSAILQQVIYDTVGHSLSAETGERASPNQALQAVIQTTADARYTVRVSDVGDGESCQSYTLRVDPQFCTDNHEDNDDVEHATRLTWDAHEQASTQGTVYEGDDDYFEVTTTRADPVLLTGRYSASAGSTVQVRRTIYDGAGSVTSSTTGERKQATEPFTHWLPAPTKASVIRTLLAASGSGCASFELSLDAAACTDAFEDNDKPTDAAPLTLGSDIKATMFWADDDYYALPSLGSGMCSVTYEIPSGKTQQAALRVYDGSGSVVAYDSSGELNGRVKTLRATWTDHAALSVVVTADDSDYCQPYTLRCE
jgi:hypothetical protein